MEDEEKELKNKTPVDKTPQQKEDSKDLPKIPKPEKPTLTPVVEVDLKGKEVKIGWKDKSTDDGITVEVEGGKKFSYSTSETSGYGSVKATSKPTPKTEVVGSTNFDSGKQQVKADAQVTHAVTPKIKLGAQGSVTFDQAKHTTTEIGNINANWQPDKNTKVNGSVGYTPDTKETNLKLDGERKLSDEWTVKNSTGYKINDKGNTFENTAEGKYKPNDVWDFASKVKYTNPPGPVETWSTSQTANVNLGGSKNFNMAIEHVYDLKKGQTNEITGKAEYKIKDMDAYIKGGAIRDDKTNKLTPSVGIGVIKHF